MTPMPAFANLATSEYMSMESNGVDEAAVRTTPSAARKEATHRRSSGSTGKPRKPANLACLNCRPRKIKCNRVDGACERCRMLNLPCKVPDRDERKLRYSKEYIEGLENEIAELRHALDQARNSEQAASPTTLSHTDSYGASIAVMEPAKGTPPEKEASPSDNLIDRLCSMKRRVSSNTDGQARYFGPTSCLHFTETPASITSYSQSIAESEIDLDKGIPEALQQYLLDLYWSYQHSVLPVVHKEAFLSGLQTGRGPYYSRCLLLSLLAAGARISALPQIRNLSIAVDDVDKELRRPLFKQAEEALEKEIINPSVTTIQSLLLLSVMHCGQSNDSKGWMLSGNACRLVFDLGLHQDWTYFSATKLTEIDIEVRQVVFWGCFGLDRLWALYLGRPPFIKLTDVSIRRPDRNARTWDLRIFAAWVRLLDTAGQIGDKLNTNACSQGQIDCFQASLNQWQASLEPALSFDVHANPALYHLHMQYSAMNILLNRHNAGFGNPEKRNSIEAINSREVCLDHAFRISHMLQGYKSQHGEAYTMIGSALYNTTMAATTLVAELSETRKEGNSEELICLMTCLRAMKEMEHTELVAKNVYNIVQTIMRVCNVRDDGSELELLSMSMPAATPRTEPLQLSYDPATANVGLNQTTLAMWPAFDFEGVDMEEPFPFAFEQPVLAAESASCLPSMQQFM